jgi:hypothetical protein
VMLTLAVLNTAIRLIRDQHANQPAAGAAAAD